MSELILIDRTTKQEIGRRPMAPQERYSLYSDCASHALLAFSGKRYTLYSVAWRIPEENCVATVMFDSHECLPCGCTAGCCTCD